MDENAAETWIHGVCSRMHERVCTVQGERLKQRLPPGVELGSRWDTKRSLHTSEQALSTVAPLMFQTQ